MFFVRTPWAAVLIWCYSGYRPPHWEPFPCSHPQDIAGRAVAVFVEDFLPVELANAGDGNRVVCGVLWN